MGHVPFKSFEHMAAIRNSASAVHIWRIAVNRRLGCSITMLLHGLNDMRAARYSLFASAQSAPVSRAKLIQGCYGMDWRGLARTRKLVAPAATNLLLPACGTIHYVRQRTEMLADDAYP